MSVHADDRAYKPLNWMSPPCWLTETEGEGGDDTSESGAPTVWVVENKAGEQLRITIESIEHDSAHELGVDPGLVKDGVEAHLQELLAEHVALLGDGYTLVRREYMTPIGPVDLLCRDADGATVAVEIKRRGEIDGVEQLTRYLELLNRDTTLAPVAGVLRRSRSSHRLVRLPKTVGSGASHWITTLCGEWTRTSSDCSDMVRHGKRRQPRREVPAALSIGGDQVEQGVDGFDYHVRRIAGARAVKVYRCPGCDHEIAIGIAHVVVWPAEGNPERGMEDRRHWHTPCWGNRVNRSPTRRWS